MCDASVDLEMFCNQNELVDMVATGMLLSPTACSNWMPLEDGQLARAAETCGDGACSLHALWGTLRSYNNRTDYFCEDARRTLCNAMPADVQELINSRCGAAAEALLEDLWTDVVDYRKRIMQHAALFPGEFFFFTLRISTGPLL